jgi:hypothetical protein
MKVMAVDDQMYRPDGKEASISAKTVTLLATPKQAARITHACEIGKVRLVLCSGKETPETDTAGGEVDTPELFSSSSSSGPSGSNKLVDLPPVNDKKKPGFAQEFEGGVNALRSMLKDLQSARDAQFVEEKEKPYTVVLIEGPDSREIEFDPASTKGRQGTGLAALKAVADAAAAEEKKAEEPAAKESPETDNMLKSLFPPDAQRRGTKLGGPKLVQ